jgi:hypothetical protein
MTDNKQDDDWFYLWLLAPVAVVAPTVIFYIGKAWQ